MMFRQLPTRLIESARTALTATCVLVLVLLIGASPKQNVTLLATSTPAVPAPQPSIEAPELLRDVAIHGTIPAADVATNTPITAANRDAVIDHATNSASSSPQSVLMEVTAYCACQKCCGPNAVGITASGLHVSYNEGRFVAADPSLPFGTRLVIPGYSDHPVEVIDRGSAIRGDKLDVFFSSHSAALEWGRRVVSVTVVE